MAAFSNNQIQPATYNASLCIDIKFGDQRSRINI